MTSIMPIRLIINQASRRTLGRHYCLPTTTTTTTTTTTNGRSSFASAAKTSTKTIVGDDQPKKKKDAPPRPPHHHHHRPPPTRHARMPRSKNDARRTRSPGHVYRACPRDGITARGTCCDRNSGVGGTANSRTTITSSGRRRGRGNRGASASR